MCRVPIVTFGCCGISEYMRNETYGVVAGPGDWVCDDKRYRLLRTILPNCSNALVLQSPHRRVWPCTRRPCCAIRRDGRQLLPGRNSSCCSTTPTRSSTTVNSENEDYLRQTHTHAHICVCTHAHTRTHTPRERDTDSRAHVHTE